MSLHIKPKPTHMVDLSLPTPHIGREAAVEIAGQAANFGFGLHHSTGIHRPTLGVVVVASDGAVEHLSIGLHSSTWKSSALSSSL